MGVGGWWLEQTSDVAGETPQWLSSVSSISSLRAKAAKILRFPCHLIAYVLDFTEVLRIQVGLLECFWLKGLCWRVRFSPIPSHWVSAWKPVARGQNQPFGALGIEDPWIDGGGPCGRRQMAD